MGRPKEKVDPERGKRLRKWIKKIGLKQYECAALIPMTEEAFCNVIKSGKLTYENACIISDKTVQHTEDGTPYQVRVDYLMNRDNFMTTLDYEEHIATIQWQKNKYDMNKCANALILAAIKSATIREWNDKCSDIELEELMNNKTKQEFPEIPPDDFQLIWNLVTDYAYNLVHSYLYDPSNSMLWNRILTMRAWDKED